MSSFKVKIADDGPIAEDDMDMALEGGMTEGNVITGDEPDTDPAAQGAQVADIDGADGGGMTMSLSEMVRLGSPSPKAARTSSDDTETARWLAVDRIAPSRTTNTAVGIRTTPRCVTTAVMTNPTISTIGATRIAGLVWLCS